MFGIIIGTISLVALIATLRRGRGGFGGASRGFRHVTSRLKASPSQEDALRTVADDLFATGRATREDGLALRQALISALEKDALEPTSLDDALGRFDTATERLRVALVARDREGPRDARPFAEEDADRHAEPRAVSSSSPPLRPLRGVHPCVAN
jgi:hypothetical protein